MDPPTATLLRWLLLPLRETRSPGRLLVSLLVLLLCGVAWWPPQVKGAGAVGPIVFACVYFVGTILFFPGSVLTIGSGFAFAQAFGQGWGIVAGSLVVFVGATTGAAASFLLGRYALRSLVADKARQYRILAAIDRALEGQVCLCVRVAAPRLVYTCAC